MNYTLNSDFTVTLENGDIIRPGDMVKQEDLPKWGPKKIKKFFYPENIDNIYAQFDEGRGCNDGCLPVKCLIKSENNQK